MVFNKGVILGHELLKHVVDEATTILDQPVASDNSYHSTRTNVGLIKYSGTAHDLNITINNQYNFGIPCPCHKLTQDIEYTDNMAGHVGVVNGIIDDDVVISTDSGAVADDGVNVGVEESGIVTYDNIVGNDDVDSIQDNCCEEDCHSTINDDNSVDTLAETALL